MVLRDGQVRFMTERMRRMRTEVGSGATIQPCFQDGAHTSTGHRFAPVHQAFPGAVSEPAVSYPRLHLTQGAALRRLAEAVEKLSRRSCCIPRHNSRTMPPRSMVGQSALNRSIGVRIPGGQPSHTLRLIPGAPVLGKAPGRFRPDPGASAPTACTMTPPAASTRFKASSISSTIT